MNRTIKNIAFILAVIMILATPVFAAEENAPQPRESATLQEYAAFLHVPSGNQIQLWFDVIGTRRLDQVGSTRIIIQCSSDGVGWTTMKTYNYTSYSNMMATNAYDHCSYVTYYGTYNCYYRAYVTIQGTLGTESSTRYIYTDTIKLVRQP